MASTTSTMASAPIVASTSVAMAATPIVAAVGVAMAKVVGWREEENEEEKKMGFFGK